MTLYAVKFLEIFVTRFYVKPKLAYYFVDIELEFENPQQYL